MTAVRPISAIGIGRSVIMLLLVVVVACSPETDKQSSDDGFNSENEDVTSPPVADVTSSDRDSTMLSDVVEIEDLGGRLHSVRVGTLDEDDIRLESYKLVSLLVWGEQTEATLQHSVDSSILKIGYQPNHLGIRLVDYNESGSSYSVRIERSGRYFQIESKGLVSETDEMLSPFERVSFEGTPSFQSASEMLPIDEEIPVYTNPMAIVEKRL